MNGEQARASFEQAIALVKAGQFEEARNDFSTVGVLRRTFAPA